MKRSDYDPRQVEWRNAPMQQSMSAAYLFYFVKKRKDKICRRRNEQQPIFSLYTFSFFIFMGNDQQHPDAIEATIK
jgi:hypothetical protein